MNCTNEWSMRAAAKLLAKQNRGAFSLLNPDKAILFVSTKVEPRRRRRQKQIVRGVQKEPKRLPSAPVQRIADALLSLMLIVSDVGPCIPLGVPGCTAGWSSPASAWPLQGSPPPAATAGWAGPSRCLGRRRPCPRWSARSHTLPLETSTHRLRWLTG